MRPVIALRAPDRRPRRPGPRRIGHRPMQEPDALGEAREFLVGDVADGDDEIGVSVSSSIDRGRALVRSRPTRAAAFTASGRTWSAGRVPALVAGTSWRAFQAAAASCDRAELALQTKSTCRATSVATGSAITESGVGDEPNVSSTGVSVGRVALDEPRVLQHPEVMREQVRPDRERSAELRGGTVGHRQLVDDLQPMRIRERRMDRRPPRDDHLY